MWTYLWTSCVVECVRDLRILTFYAEMALSLSFLRHLEEKQEVTDINVSLFRSDPRSAFLICVLLLEAGHGLIFRDAFVSWLESVVAW
jgi:hypothetical protein